MENYFNPVYLKRQLQQLAPGTAPVFGKMQPQQMVEHLVMAMRLSNGKINSRLFTSAESLPKMRAFLLSDKEIQPGFRSPVAGEEPPAPVYQHIAEATEVLLSEIADFYTWFTENPESRPVHPVFGALGRQEWVVFHTKHMKHHLKQFGLASV